jgi:hypothetical protein
MEYGHLKRKSNSSKLPSLYSNRAHHTTTYTACRAISSLHTSISIYSSLSPGSSILINMNGIPIAATLTFYLLRFSTSAVHSTPTRSRTDVASGNLTQQYAHG